MHKSFAVLAALTALLALGGCASLRSVDSDVSTYSEWPAGRKPATYAFDRLPSQQARAERQQQLEDAARAAIEAAGFTLADDAAQADVNVQLGAHLDSSTSPLYANPFWWHGGVRVGFYGGRPRGGRYSVGFWGPGMGFGWSAPTVYEREVAVLIRDRATGKTLYEAHASNEGSTWAYSALLPAMFAAALKDFPSGGINPRRVSIDLGPQ